VPNRGASKPTLVLVHAAGRGGRSWRGAQDRLSDAFEVHAPDLPGFAAAAGTPFTMAAAVRAISELAGAHRPPVRLVGLSLGASVAIAVVAAHPDLVDRLVLCAPAVRPADRPRTMAVYRRAPGWLIRWVTDLPGRSAWLALIDELATIDLTDVVRAVTVPTLVLCGRRDRENLADARFTADAIAGARLVVVPHVGHVWPVTQPKLFDAVVRPFLTASRVTAE
jgi:3-oxoadipate enol-lactonase